MFHETFIPVKPLAPSPLSVGQGVGTCEAVAGVGEAGVGVLGQLSEREGLVDLEMDRPVGLRQDGARRRPGNDGAKKMNKNKTIKTNNTDRENVLIPAPLYFLTAATSGAVPSLPPNTKILESSRRWRIGRTTGI